VFASAISRDGHVNKKGLNTALGKVGFPHDRHVAHGFRSTFSTQANESALWAPDVIELQLAHVEGNAVRRAYNRQARWPERVALMSWWGDQLDEMRDRIPRSYDKPILAV